MILCADGKELCGPGSYSLRSHSIALRYSLCFEDSLYRGAGELQGSWDIQEGCYLPSHTWSGEEGVSPSPAFSSKPLACAHWLLHAGCTFLRWQVPPPPVFLPMQFLLSFPNRQHSLL